MIKNSHTIKRHLYIKLWRELTSEKQMVFLSGPRQVGKTTLANEIASEFKNKLYFCWDIVEHRKKLIQNPAFFENINRVDESMPLIVFDEIHKYRQWKNYLKGIYDQFADEYKFLVSGSGRLDLYQKGGDSLAGRYFQFHLFPFTLAELDGKKRNINDFLKHPINNFDINKPNITREIWQALSQFGGFPEPFTKGKKSFFTKWSVNYASQIVREDIKSISDIKNVDNVEILFSLLPSKVGSPLSVNNLVGELQVSYGSVKEWLKLFEIFYLTFRISPWTKKVSRAILKEKKLYLFNYPEIPDAGFRFENMVAVELLRAIYNWNEYGYGRFSLHYIRNKEKEEVDFVIAKDNNPVLLVETKYSGETVPKNLINFQKRLNVPAVQLVNKEHIFRYIKNEKNKILVITAYRWLSSLP
ncbi:MAG: ATP-binding protein [Elusimicrobia bacterium]|nr:ATP-binding protein [Elusimicrobiota bacterium]